jgi:hypothetical protein
MRNRKATLLLCFCVGFIVWGVALHGEGMDGHRVATDNIERKVGNSD